MREGGGGERDAEPAAQRNRAPAGETSKCLAAFPGGRNGSRRCRRRAWDSRWHSEVAAAYRAKTFAGSDAMTKACEKWKDQLLEAALTGAKPKDLEVHLQSCKDCAAELRKLEACRTQQDSLLPMLVKGAQPSADFRAHVLAAAEASGGRKIAMRWRSWKLAGAMVTAAPLLVIWATLYPGAARI